MKVILDRLYREPVFLGSVLTAVVGLAVSFGLGWSGEQVGMVTGAIALITGYAGRSRVMPVS